MLLLVSYELQRNTNNVVMLIYIHTHTHTHPHTHTSMNVRIQMGEGYKILYSREKSSRNGVGVILSPEFKEKVVEVSRPSDRLVKLKLVIAGEIFNTVSAYAPQSGETEMIKEGFLKDWEDVM